MRHVPSSERNPPLPIGIHPYFDKLQFWVRQPLDNRELTELKRICGRGKVRTFFGPARFGDGFRQRAILWQPPEDALRWLAIRKDARINQVEIALDYIFDTPSRSDAACEFLDRHLVRPWHRGNQEIKLVSRNQHESGGERRVSLTDNMTDRTTRYDAARYAPNRIVLYQNEYSRLTGELNCLHLEWRITGVKAIRRVGIQCGEDLLHFNHRAFWEKRLLLFDVDSERLGRLIRNKETGKKSRTPKYEDQRGASVNIDAKTGTIFKRSYRVVQELIDDVRKTCRIERALISIPTELLLPD